MTTTAPTSMSSLSRLPEEAALPEAMIGDVHFRVTEFACSDAAERWGRVAEHLAVWLQAEWEREQANAGNTNSTGECGLTADFDARASPGIVNSGAT